MIWVLATRGAITRLRASPFTETTIEGVHSVVYRPGIEPIPFAGDVPTEPLGVFGRGVQRISGVLFSHDGAAAEKLLGITAEIDLIVRYQAESENRVRTFSDVLFVGDATVTVPSLNTGLPPLIGVPFRVQIPFGETLAQHISDAAE